jgi:hypothetical protein
MPLSGNPGRAAYSRRSICDDADNRLVFIFVCQKRRSTAPKLPGFFSSGRLHRVTSFSTPATILSVDGIDRYDHVRGSLATAPCLKRSN